MSERVRKYLAGDGELVVSGDYGRDPQGNRLGPPLGDDTPAAERVEHDDPYTSDLRLPFNRPVRVGSEREGWRARLANVERLLSEALTGGDGENYPRVDPIEAALAEVRSMIDGDE